MDIKLTLEMLLSTFEKYNVDIWPLQVLAYILGITAVFFAIKRRGYSSRIIQGILSFLWLFTGFVFFMLYFGAVYTPAYIFGALFIIQGVMFLASLAKPRLSFNYEGNSYTVFGLLFIAYAMIGYPVVG